MPDLTPAQVLKEPAGPRINAWIAERVMGWTIEVMPNNGQEMGHVGQSRAGAGSVLIPTDWSPSTDIAPAWEVWEKLTGHRDWWQTAIHRCDGHWRASGYKHGSSVRDLAADAPTAPLAICRAALLTTLEVKATSDA